MDFSDYLLRLGAEPRSKAPEILLARESSPEHRAAAREADRFEGLLERALAVDVPPFLFERLRAIPLGTEPRPDHGSARPGTGRWRLAFAAGLLLAVAAAGTAWRMNTRWDSVPEYVIDHYRHDGASVLERAAGGAGGDVDPILAELGFQAAPALARMVKAVKHCPTPGGKGVHLVIDTDEGLVTLIFMPRTSVTDGERVIFDDRQALLVALARGSAVIVGTDFQHLDGLQTLVQASIRPLRRSA